MIIQRGGGVTIPATVVKTDQGNTYSTGAQNYAAATSLTAPTSAGAAPTTDGQLAFDSTGKRLRWAQDSTSVSGNGVLSVQLTGDTNNSSSGSGADYDHTLTYAIPAGILNHVGRTLRVTQTWYLTTGSSAPNLQYKLKLGSTTIFSNEGASAPGVNLTTRTFTITYDLFVSTAGASGAVICAASGAFHAAALNTSSTNGVAQPVGTFDTTGALTLTHTSRWATAGTGTNTIQLLAAKVEVLN